MEQFYSKMSKEYSRLRGVFLQARKKVDSQDISTQLLEDVDQALNDTSELLNEVQNAHDRFEPTEFEDYSEKINNLRTKTNVLYNQLAAVKEEIDRFLKQHQVMHQLQKSSQKTEEEYNRYLERMEKILQEFKTETNDGVKTTVEELKGDIEDDFQARIKEATDTIKKEFDETLGTEKKSILEKFETDYTAKLDDFKTDVMEPALTTKMQSFEKESLNPLEQRTLTNVLTIFGVFASFITIVMVLVGTSSSWLNSSDISSAIIAFVVPSGIGVLVVCALTAFVRIIAGDRANVEQLNLRSLFKKWVLWLIVPVVCVFTVKKSIDYSISQEAAKEPTHKIFVYNLSDCLCEEDGATREDGTKEIKQFVEISYFKNKSDEYVVERKEYDEYESFIHDGKLFYCVIHECFE